MNTGMRRRRAMTGQELDWHLLDTGEKPTNHYLVPSQRNITTYDTIKKKSILVPFTTCLKNMPFLRKNGIESDIHLLLEKAYRQLKEGNYEFISPNQIFTYYKSLCNCEITL